MPIHPGFGIRRNRLELTVAPADNPVVLLSPDSCLRIGAARGTRRGEVAKATR